MFALHKLPVVFLGHKTEDLFFECLKLLKDSSFFTGYSKNINANQDLRPILPQILTSNSALSYLKFCIQILALPRPIMPTCFGCLGGEFLAVSPVQLPASVPCTPPTA